MWVFIVKRRIYFLLVMYLTVFPVFMWISGRFQDFKLSPVSGRCVETSLTPKAASTNRSLMFGNSDTVTPPAVIFSPQGRLGNQLFGYACHYALARKHGWPLYILLKENVSIASQESNQFPLFHFQLPVYAHKLLDASVKVPEKVQVNESCLLSGEYPLQKSIFLGYCQSEVFFSSYRDELLNYVFQFKENSVRTPLTTYWQHLITEGEGESVSVHFRRGDYVTNFNEIPSANFYTNCMEVLEQKLEGRFLQYFIFSDDQAYIKKLFKNSSRVIHIVSSIHLQEIHDLFLMSLCKHHINPPSSFSWWGAYLSRLVERGGIVCAAPHKDELFSKVYRGVESAYYTWQFKHLYYPSSWYQINGPWEK